MRTWRAEKENLRTAKVNWRRQKVKRRRNWKTNLKKERRTQNRISRIYRTQGKTKGTQPFPDRRVRKWGVILEQLWRVFLKAASEQEGLQTGQYQGLAGGGFSGWVFGLLDHADLRGFELLARAEECQSQELEEFDKTRRRLILIPHSNRRRRRDPRRNWRRRLT